MTLTIRLVFFLGILWLSSVAEKNPPKIGSNRPSILAKSLAVVFLVSGISWLGGMLFWFFEYMVGDFGNQIVTFPAMVGSCSLFVSIIIWLIIRRWVPSEMYGIVLALPFILNLALLPTIFSATDFFLPIQSWPTFFPRLRWIIQRDQRTTGYCSDPEILSRLADPINSFVFNFS